MNILLVEDERPLAEAVADVLGGQNYKVDIAFDGEEGFYRALSDVYDVIVLDIMLPRMDGITILKKIRKENITAPVILLTAKSEIEDRIEGLDSGADDYLTKPFSTGELLARIRALGRRRVKEFLHDGLLQLGELELNPHTLYLTNGAEMIRLTKKESQLMELLIARRKMITSKDMIIEKVWGYDSEAEGRNVEVYISFLRKKLSKLKADYEIKVLRGVGYQLQKVSKEGV